MENQTLFFYNVKVGRSTKRGGFITEYSFVCKSENDSQNDVYKHYSPRYKGLEVRVDSIEDVIHVHIEADEKQDFMGRTKKEKELLRKIEELKKDKTKTYLDHQINPKDFPPEAKIQIEKMKRIIKRHSQIRERAEGIIRNKLYEKYGSICKNVSFTDDLTHKDIWCKYRVEIDGKIIEE